MEGPDQEMGHVLKKRSTTESPIEDGMDTIKIQYFIYMIVSTTLDNTNYISQYLYFLIYKCSTSLNLTYTFELLLAQSLDGITTWRYISIISNLIIQASF